MEIAIYVIVSVAINMVVGAVVWSSIDDKDKRLYRWYKDCPPQISWIAQPIVLSAWPFGLWLWWTRRNSQSK